MSGNATYTQPLSRTMEHNVNVIVNDNKIKNEEDNRLNPQNKNAQLSLLEAIQSASSGAQVQSTGQVEEKEDETLYENIDTKQSSGLKITWRPWTAIYDIELFFHGRYKVDDSEFAFEPHQFSKLTIEEMFVENFADHISITVTLTPNELLLMLDNYRNLRAHIYIRRMHPDTEYIDKENPVMDKDYKVIFKDKELRKRVSKRALIPNEYKEKTDEHHNQQFTNVELQLVTDEEYELKNKRFHFILTDATVKDAICYAVKQLGIKQISMPEPDNKAKYVNMIIPPQQSFKSFMDFLQDRYGVYDEGCNFYYNNEIMFIYPPYKRTVTDCPETAHFYCTGNGSYQGLKFYHAKDQNNMYHIVINRTPVIKEMIDSGAENIGNEILFQHSDKLIDLHSVIGEGKGQANARMGLGEITINDKNTTKFRWDHENQADLDYGIINNPLRQEFISTNNMSKYKSEIKSYRGTLCAFEWGTAEPYFLRPGYAVKWHIDGERDEYFSKKEKPEDHLEEFVRDTLEYKTYDGIARSIFYKLMPAATPKANRYPFSCVANIVLDLNYLPAKKVSDPADIITDQYTEVSEQTDSAYAQTESYDASPGKNNSTSKTSDTDTKRKYNEKNNSHVTNRSDPELANRADPLIVYLLSYTAVSDGMKEKYECKWSDGTTTYMDTDQRPPKYKPTETKQMSSLFDLK